MITADGGGGVGGLLHVGLHIKKQQTLLLRRSCFKDENETR